ncbi:MAG: osmotically inducible protein OsmC [Candidatus Neomarinimicrobiota bacterium]|nr:MAG: osmotically inducible protein OsmC [Candidatus Neomarinimicrobiota bacterium]
MEMTITFPGGKKVAAHFGRFTIPTDQPRAAGGDDSAPAPFDLFLASIGTCAGIYVLGFCQQRGIDTTGLSLSQSIHFNRETRLVDSIRLTIHLPQNFPEKYRSAILATANLCTVKKHLEHPPAITVEAV